MLNVQLRGYPFGPRVDHDLCYVILLVPPYFVHLGGFVKSDAVRDEIARIDLALLDTLEEGLHVVMHIGLAHLHRDAFSEGGTERDLIEQSPIDTRDGKRSSLSDRLYRLAQHAGPIDRDLSDVTTNWRLERVGAATVGGVLGAVAQEVVL